MHATTTNGGVGGEAGSDQTHATELTAHESLLRLAEAAAALGLRPATIKQYIQKGQLAAVRVPCGKATRLFIASAEIDRYRRTSLGGQGWPTRRARTAHAPASPADESDAC